MVVDVPDDSDVEGENTSNEGGFAKNVICWEFRVSIRVCPMACQII